MTQVVIKHNKNKEIIKGLNYMNPCEVGIIITEGPMKDTVVMRTPSVEHFQVINLSKFEESCCWTYRTSNLKVKIYPNTKITVELGE